MKKQYYLLLILSFVFILSSCDKSGGGKIYVTDELCSTCEIFTVKILEHTYNESTEKNIFSDYSDKISYGGYTWYVYDIPEGTWDIYIEYYRNGEFYNERESVYIEDDSSGNEWAAVWLLNDSEDYWVWTEQGSGSLNLTSSMFY